MKVSIELSPEYRIPYAVIYADKITDEIQTVSYTHLPLTVKCILYISVPELHRYGKYQPAEILRSGVMYNKNVP